MRYLIWSFRGVLFLLLLGFAVKNDEPVVLRYYFGFEWHTTLVLALLCFFALGAVIGVAAVLSNLLKQRRELSSLKREIRLKNKLAVMDESHSPIQPS
jgi:uncharacterized integral membrane protein